MQHENEVVITGIGSIAGRAVNTQELFESLWQKQSMVRCHPRYLAYGLINPACAFIDEETREKLLDAHARHFNYSPGPQALYAVHAAQEAMAQSGIEHVGGSRGGLFVASNKYLVDEHQLMELANYLDPVTGIVDWERFLADGRHAPELFFHKRQDQANATLARRYGFGGVLMTPGDACAAGGISIGTAYRMIRKGELDVALAGATEAMCNYAPMIGFAALGAMSINGKLPPEKISKPFDKTRSGFVMGEGSAFLVLESRTHAEKRQAKILARVCGFAKRSEAYRITSSNFDGSDYARCMLEAIQDAGISADEIDHVNAHGTATIHNDACEAAALKRVFGARVSRVPVTSNKSALGHALAASGALEAALSVHSLRSGKILPTLNHETKDEATEGINIVTEPTHADMQFILSNSFGFGGENCSLVLGKA